MKKESILLLLFCLVVTSRLFSQDIKPSEQAQGFLDNKIGIDYSTGTFTYTIPLFEMNSGDYTLPVTLTYSAKGVRVTDKPGLYGYGWILNCGGVVSRTLRGGIADEARNGCAVEPLTVMNDSIEALIHQRKRDGESDIFSATFNGQTVHFILERKDDRTLEAIPLEKTNVKIDDVPTGSIPGWRITDEQGITYLFYEQETTRRIAIEAGVSANSVSNSGSYVSSWYLTEIILPNSRNIEFEYTNKLFNPNYGVGYSTDYYSNMAKGYAYGQPLVEHTFNSEPYQTDLDNYYTMIDFYSSMTEIEEQLRDTRYLMTEVGQALFELTGCGLLPGSGNVEFVDKMMGFITDLEKAGGNAGREAVNTLNRLIELCRPLSGTSVNYQMLCIYLENLKQTYIKILTGTENRVFGKSGQVIKYTIDTKCLTHVKCGTQEARFTYTDERFLDDVTLFSCARDTILNVKLNRKNSRVLGGIVIKGPSDSVRLSQTFTYYDSDSYSKGADAWGYYNGDTKGIECLTDMGSNYYPFIETPNCSAQMKEKLPFRTGECDEEHLKKYSLKSIRTFGGATINIDYERNRFFMGQDADADVGEGFAYSGLRVKSIAVYDEGVRTDSVHYHYERKNGASTGKLVVTGLHNGFVLNYGEFTDVVISGLIQDDGMAILGGGNNGVMYSYVREEHVGRGSSAYYFHVPQNASLYTFEMPTEHAYWMYGLPLGKIDYDERGNIGRMVKYRYHASTLPSLFFVMQDFVETDNVSFPFDKSRAQLKPFEYYMDEEEIRRDYQSRPDIFLCSDGFSYYTVNPYRDIYLPNIAPRANIVVPDQRYRLCLGGKVVLKSVESYDFGSASSDRSSRVPAYGDFFAEYPQGTYRLDKQDFYYGESHTAPVKTVWNKSNGDRVVSYTRRVCDVENDGLTEIARLREMNVLSPVVQEQTFVVRGDTAYKIGEIVTSFRTDTLQGKEGWFPVRRSVLDLESPLAEALPGTGPISDPFSTDTAAYTHARYHYSKPYDAFVLSVEETEGETVAFVHDGGNNVEIFRGIDVPSVCVDASDSYRVRTLSDLQTSVLNRDGGLFVVYTEHYDDDSSFMACLAETTEQLRESGSVQATSAYKEGLFDAVQYFMEGLYDFCPYHIIKPYRELLLQYPDFTETILDALGSCGDLDAGLVQKYGDILWSVWQNVIIFDESNYRLRGLKGDSRLAGMWESGNLRVETKGYRRFDLFVLTRDLWDTYKDVEFELLYKDGTSHVFHDTLRVGHDSWTIATLNVDLRDFDNPEDIVALEARVLFGGSNYEDGFHGNVSAALVPEGVEFEAVSRDKYGRVFCVWEQSGQMERYEYDGLGRVTKVFDRDGNVLRENVYHVASQSGGFQADWGLPLSGDKNYAACATYVEASTEEGDPGRVVDVSYLDGQGRATQDVAVGGSPGGDADLVTARAHGPGGRVEREWLPLVLEGNDGGFVSGQLPLSGWGYLGAEEAPHAFASTEYEDSPLDRPLRETGPGRSWRTAGKSVEYGYGSNGAGEVRRYRVGPDGSLRLDGHYAAGTLSKTSVRDEDGKVSVEYRDGGGNVVSRGVLSGGDTLATYLVYDDLGRLRLALPPEASRRLASSVDTAVLARLAFRYDYDRKGRVVAEKVPGAAPVYFVYDKKGRPVLSQDGNQRERNEWSYTLYDGLNRAVETGVVRMPAGVSHGELQAEASACVDYAPSGERTPLRRVAYDNYEAAGEASPLPYVAAEGFDTARVATAPGLPTTVMTRILGTDRWLASTAYYDSRGREVLVVSENHLGGTSSVHTSYDFTGNVVKTREAHGFGGETRVLQTENAYDARGRLLRSAATLDGGSPVRAEYGHDVAGRLVTVARGGLADSLSYNVRGWLTGKRSGAFTMALHYADGVVAGVGPSWNGDISAWEWGHGADTDRMLSFSYDGADRLTGSTAFERVGAGWTESPAGSAERDITYDGNGNLLTLRRTAGGAVVDDLEYGYEGNRLVSVEDKAQPGRTGDVFRVGNSSYAYDANGNMVEDSGRKLTFGYNVLDLLETAVAEGGDTLAVYGWSADGARLWVRDGSGDGLDYLGSLTLATEGGETRLETAAVVGGVIRVGSDGRQAAEYHVTDHLGSVRVVVDGEGDALERNDYYPFGARFGDEGWPESGNRFKFNGKEEQETGGLGYLDYGARMYDPAVGRWWSVDPAAGSACDWTPYRYGLNNPVLHVDKDGLWEKTSMGWYTENSTDIRRLISMMDIETSLYGSVSEAQFFKFVQEEYDGLGGRLSNGSILLSELEMVSFGNRSYFKSLKNAYSVLDEIDRFGSRIFESNILHSRYTYKYFREKSWERMKAKFPIETLTGYGVDIFADRLWNKRTWTNLPTLRSYKQGFYGNQYFTSDKVRLSKNVSKYVSKGLKWGGKILSVYDLRNTIYEYKTSKLSVSGALYTAASTIVGMAGGLGGAWSFGTSIGKSVFESNWYFDIMYGNRRW